MNLEGSFSLVALFDGTTLNGMLRVEVLPLIQYYTEGTTKYTPDFEALTENERPVVALIMRNISDGTILQPQSITWKYNGVELAFDAETGLCTTGDLKDVLKKIDNYNSTVEGQGEQVPALRVMKNLVPISHNDNDRISVCGKVEINGQSIPFKEISTEVIIKKSALNSYNVVISDNKGSWLTKKDDSLQCKATLYRDTIEVTDTVDYTYQWVKLLGTTDENFKTGQTITITTNDVDNVLKLRCDVSYKGKFLASGFTQITDVSDPYYVDFEYGPNITGNCVRYGQEAIVTPVARKRVADGGPGDKLDIKSWNFNIKDNEGKDFILSGKDKPTFVAPNVKIGYQELIRAKGGINGSVSTTI